MKPEICLGTVQFGMNYGITNNKGKIQDIEISKILNAALKYKVPYIDTAQDYGDAESKIGKYSPDKNNFKIISKININEEKIRSLEPYEYLKRAIEKTLYNLNTKSIDCLLIHNSEVLKSKKNSELIFEYLNEFKRLGMFKRLGISIYQKSDLENIYLKNFQLIQVPLSIYDQRLIENGTLSKLNNMGIKIHVRSVFLQGLILRNPDFWPEFLSDEFKVHHIKFFNDYGKNEKSLLENALNFVKNIKYLEAILFGTTSLMEFKQVLNVWESIKINNENNFHDWAWQNDFDLDPRKWQLLK